MHKYQPRVHIIKKPEDSSYLKMNLKLQTTSDLEHFDYKTFVFSETSFIAVTAYQNQLVRYGLECNKEILFRIKKFYTL
jgi:hypothetical protein